jgi:hypothetical protein
MKSEIRPAGVVMTMVGLMYVCAKSCIMFHFLKTDKAKRRHILSGFPNLRINASGTKANE